jgi:hypothetical protein
VIRAPNKSRSVRPVKPASAKLSLGLENQSQNTLRLELIKYMFGKEKMVSSRKTKLEFMIIFLNLRWFDMCVEDQGQ